MIGRTKGGMNTKLHAVTDADGRSIRFFMTAGQVSDYTGAAALPGSLPKAEWLLADRDLRALNQIIEWRSTPKMIRGDTRPETENGRENLRPSPRKNSGDYPT